MEEYHSLVDRQFNGTTQVSKKDSHIRSCDKNRTVQDIYKTVRKSKKEPESEETVVILQRCESIRAADKLGF